MAYNFGGYGERALDHYDHPRNVGEIAAPDAEAAVSNPGCGDTLKLTLRIGGGVLLEAKFKAAGCSGVITASSAVTEMIRGRTLEEAERLTSADVAAALGGMPPARIHGARLAERAVKAALAAYRGDGLRRGEEER